MIKAPSSNEVKKKEDWSNGTHYVRSYIAIDGVKQ